MLQCSQFTVRFVGYRITKGVRLKQEIEKSTNIAMIQEFYFLVLIPKVSQETMIVASQMDLMKEEFYDLTHLFPMHRFSTT